MIQNNSLGDRLNSYKQGAANNSPEVTNAFQTLVTILTYLLIMLKIIVFGYSVKIIWNTDWNIWKVLCIGIAINFIFTFISDIFSKLNNN